MTLYHLLKLFQSDTNAMLGKKTVVSEFYDEMVDFIMRGLSKTLRVWCGGQSTALGVVLSFHCVGRNSALRLGSKHLHLLSVLARSCSELLVFFSHFIPKIFQDPTAMMQQLLTTSRQLTLGAYKHETECKCFRVFCNGE